MIRCSLRTTSTVFLALFLLFVACLGAAAQGLSGQRLRIVHAALGGPAVDIYIDGAGTPDVTGLDFLHASQFIALSAAEHTGRAVLAGADYNSTPNVDLTRTLASETIQTGIVHGTFPAPQVLWLTRATDLAPPAGQTLLRVVHASAGTGPVDLKIRDISGGTRDLNDLAAGTASDYITLPGGETTIDVTDGAGNTFFVGRGALPPEGLVTIIATGAPGGSFRLNVLLDSDTNAQKPMARLDDVTPTEQGVVRFIHVSPDAGPIDVLLDAGISERVPLGFRDGSQAYTVAGGTTRAYVVPRDGERSAAIHQADVEFPVGLYRAFYLIGSTTQGNLSLLKLDADPRVEPPAGKALLRVLNAVTENVPLDVDLEYADATTKAYESFGFRSFTQFSPIPAGTLHVRATDPTSSDLVLDVIGTIPPGARATLVLTGATVAEARAHLVVDSENGAQLPLAEFLTTDVPIVIATGAQRSFTISPNPAHSTLAITFLERAPRSASIELYDALGSRVASFDASASSGGELRLDVGELAPGFYTLAVKDEASGSVVGVEKIIVRR